MKEIKIKIENNKCLCECPLNYELIENFHNLNGKWNGQCWSFDELLYEDIKELMIKYFGADNGEYPSCQLLIKDYTAISHLKPITILGIPLCRAFGKYSGAVICDDVVLLDGRIKSGGSGRYWAAECHNATFKILHFPVSLLSNETIKELSESNKIEITYNN